MSESAWRVLLADVEVDDELVAVVEETLRSGWWSMGPRVAAFEREFADFCGSSHAIAVSSGTAALQLALAALGLGPGDEVVLPSLNFVAAANVVVHVGATPVFCDVKGGIDLNLDPASLERAVTERTKAMLVLHYGGTPCEMGAVMEIARARSLRVVEDASHAPGATWRGRMCGTIGDVGCYSFFANKNLPIGEGGMVVTDDSSLAEQIRLMRSHGMTTLTWDRFKGHAYTYDVVAHGFNFRLDEVRAAVGSAQLRRLARQNALRGQIVDRYRAAFADTPGVALAETEAPETSSAYHLAVLVLDTADQRDRLKEHLTASRVQTSLHYPPIHQFTCFAWDGAPHLPVTEDIARRILTLPLYPHMEREQIDAVIESVLSAV